MTTPRILAFAGSAREGSFNKRLLRAAVPAAEAAGAEVTQIDLRDFALPLYDGDVEEADGVPAAAQELKRLLREHDGFLLACPEYNGSITPLLKNAIDWCSRAESKDEPPLVAYRGKVAGLIAASPGSLGGLRGLVHVRAILSGIGVHVIPDQAAVSAAYKAFAEDGSLSDAGTRARVEKVAQRLVEVSARLA